MGFWTILKTVFTAIPGIVKILEMAKNAYDKYNDSLIKKHYQRKREARERLLKKLKKAKTDEERKEIADLLAIIDSQFDNI